MHATVDPVAQSKTRKVEETMRDPEVAALLDAIQTRLRTAPTPERLTLIQRLYEVIDRGSRPDSLIKHFG